MGATLIAFTAASALHASPAQAQGWGYPDSRQWQGDGWHGGWHHGWHDGWRPNWDWHRPHPWHTDFYAPPPPPYFRSYAPPPPPPYYYYGGGY